MAKNLHHNRDDDELEVYLTREQDLSFYPRNIPDRHSLLLDYTLRSTSLLSINVHDAVICTIQYSTASRKLRDSYPIKSIFSSPFVLGIITGFGGSFISYK